MRYLAACDVFFPDSPGGAQRLAWEIARSVREGGGEVALLCGTVPGGEREGAQAVEGIHVVRYDTPALHPLDPRRLHVRIASAKRAVRHHFAGKRWDVLHGHTLATGLGAYQAFPDTPRKLYSIHSPAILEQQINWGAAGVPGLAKRLLGSLPLWWAEWQLLRRSTELSSDSEFTRRKMGELFGHAVPKKTRVIPWWAPHDALGLSQAEARAKLGWPLDAQIFFTLRRMVPRMGLSVLIDASDQLSARGLDFQVYLGGEGPLRAELFAQAQRSRASDRIHFMGRLTDELVAVAYAAANAFVLPSVALECFGVIAVDALAYGCPVIASDLDAIPEIIRPILPEWLVPPGDAVALAWKMEAVATGELMAPPPDELRAYARRRYARQEIQRQYLDWIGIKHPTGASD